MTAGTTTRRTRGKPNEIDAYVGQKIRERRLVLGISQERLADALGLTFQQVQKYERGANRVGAGRLYALSLALGVSVDFFFADAPLPEKVRPMPEALAARTVDPTSSAETRRVVRAYYGVSDERIRARFLAVMRALGGQPDEPEDASPV